MSGKYALIIANTQYSDPRLAQLTAPGKDAEAFAKLLKAPDLACFDEVITLVNRSSYDARRAIARFFAEKKSEDLLLLYFSGHGVRDEQGRLFLATRDTDNGILEATAIPSDFVTRLMDNCRSKRQLLILDCCNSGAFAYGTKAAAGASMGMGSAFEGNGYGHVVLTATDATQYAYEGDQVIGQGTSNSLFTHFLIKGLEGEADANGDGMISADDLYDYASDQVRRATPNQKPEKFAYHQQEQIILTNQVKRQMVKPIPLNDPDLEVDLQSTRPYVREGAVRELATILNGSNLGRALSAEQRLKEVIQSDDSRSVVRLAEQILAEYYARKGVTPGGTRAEKPRTTKPRPPKPAPAEAPSGPTLQETPAPPAVQTPPAAIPHLPEEPAKVQAEPVGKLPAASVPVGVRKLPTRLIAMVGSVAFVAVVATAIFLSGKGAGKPSAPAATSTRAAVVAPQLTATPKPQATATVRPTATVIAGPTPIIMPSVVLKDLFIDNANNWGTGPFETEYATGSMGISAGAYNWDIASKRDTLRWVMEPSGEALSDFSMAVEGKVAYGPSDRNIGLILRRQQNYAFYYFGVNDATQMYRFERIDGDNWIDIIPPTSSKAILSGEMNRLMVVGKGSQFLFYINGQYVNQTRDVTYSSGTFGLAALLLSPNDRAVFQFDSFELRSASK